MELNLSSLHPRFLLLVACLFPLVLRAEPAPSPNDRHVVVVVWDGMRPDLVTERYAPTLWKLARDGVTFSQHHSAYLTATNVNGAAIATGVYPNRNSLLANREFRPRIDPRNAFENADVPVIKKGDDVTAGNYIAVPTIAEILHAAGRRTAIVGTKAVALLHDRHAEWTVAASKDLVKFAAAPMPAALREATLNLLGPFLTEATSTSDQRNTYATRSLTEIMWRDGLPAFSLLWLSEPDLTQHEFAPGSEPSLAAVASSDRKLALVLDAIARKKAHDSTDVLVVSDHGFSTISKAIDMAANLRAAGFDAVREFKTPAKAGQILVVSLGASIEFYVIGHNADVTHKLVDFLQRSDFPGVILSREQMEGTFTLSQVHLDSASAPDVIVSSHWNDQPNEFGAAGEVASDLGKARDQGTHSSLSLHDLHNTLIASGPDFRKGWNDEIATGNIDVAPTILALLGLKPPPAMDGRILAEALRGSKEEPTQKPNELITKRNLGDTIWRQTLSLTSIGRTTYILEGNGGRTSAKP